MSMQSMEDERAEVEVEPAGGPDDLPPGTLYGPPAPPHLFAREDFLIPGPTPTSNEGLGRWGLSWLLLSLFLMLLMLGLSFVCWFAATRTGLA